jgi:hypothetical protein
MLQKIRIRYDFPKTEINRTYRYHKTCLFSVLKFPHKWPKDKLSIAIKIAETIKKALNYRNEQLILARKLRREIF